MVETTFDEVMTWLRASADEAHLAGLARYGIPVAPALGVPMGEIKRAAKRFRPAPNLVAPLWATEIYEARVMAVHLADPAHFERATADLWCAEFDNWALCDTAAFHLFDRTSWAWDAVRDWAAAEPEYVRRAAFATLWGLSVHDKAAEDASFLLALEWAIAAADDDRVYVRKAVDMALRAVGKRNAALHDAVSAVARDLAARQDRTAAWIGRHVLKDIQSDRVLRKIGRL